MQDVSEEVKIQRVVLTKLAARAFQGRLHERVSDIFHSIVTEEGPRYRCCVYKERAILKQRINLALSQNADIDIQEAVNRALKGKAGDLPVMTILPTACNQCITDKFVVTDVCRNCVAHSCIASCPKQAIFIVQGRAFIDKTKCVACGMCRNACSYGAIIKIGHPCECACHLQAITASMNSTAEIDYDKCNGCGACKVACPFGAISDRSLIVQTIVTCKRKRTYALLDSTFASQIEMELMDSEANEAVKKIGFYDVSEVAGLEEQAVQVFDAARNIKAKDPEAAVVFIAPTIGAKAECVKASKDINFVLTFEEVNCMINASGERGIRWL
jgi:Fe-S-cluster-containing hydrogenase component 2